MMKLAQQGGVIPRRQELPATSVWNSIELFDGKIGRMQRFGQGVDIVAVSYSWLAQDHPDPGGVQLATLGFVLEQYLEVSGGCDLALFIDYCSLHQHPRTPEECEVFERSQHSVGLWYAHHSTWKWMLTRVLGGSCQVPHHESQGWPAFEWQVSQMATLPDRVLDLGQLDVTRCKDWGAIVASCRVQSRRPPALPEAFAKTLQTRSFSCASDRRLLQTGYRWIFGDVMHSVEVFDFSFHNWGDDEARQLADVLPSCNCLKRLYLSWNHIGDSGAEALATALPCCRSLQRLGIAGNPIGDIGRRRLKEAWRSTDRPEEQLALW